MTLIWLWDMQIKCHMSDPMTMIDSMLGSGYHRKYDYIEKKERKMAAEKNPRIFRILHNLGRGVSSSSLGNCPEMWGFLSYTIWENQLIAIYLFVFCILIVRRYPVKIPDTCSIWKAWIKCKHSEKLCKFNEQEEAIPYTEMR